jgi:carboxyl-terminal processing protease
MLRRIRILTSLFLFLLLLSGTPISPRPAEGGRLVGFQLELGEQGQTGWEGERELQLDQEVMGQVLNNYVLALDPVRLAVGAIDGMSTAAGGGRITAERHGDVVSVQAGNESVVLPLTRDEKINRERLAVAYRFIRKNAPNVPAQELAYGAIDGMLAQLDPHSSFMPPEMYREMQLETQGNFGGVGIQVAVKDRQLTVVTPIAGAPADRAGLQPGDRLAKIDGAPVQEMTLMEAVKRLRGPAGSKVTLTILRQDSPGPFQVALTREIIALKPIKSIELEHAVAYVKINGFSEQSGRDVQQAVKGLSRKRMQGLILDLRGNHGGLFNESIRVAELFLNTGQPIVSTVARAKNQSAEFKTTHSGPLLKVPMVVLVDGGSASASEIVAGALQDLKRALIVGRKTYGKGSVQTIIPLSDGSALRLTTAKYVTPLRQSIDGEGIHPDLVVRDQAEERSSAKSSGEESAQGKKRQRSLVNQERQRKIADEDGDPSVLIGRRDTVDPRKDPLLDLAWRTLLAAQGPEVDKLLSTARALLPVERGAALDSPVGPSVSQ